MNRHELEGVIALRRPNRHVSASDLEGPDRTLLSGYTLSRNTFHVYLEDGLIHLLVANEVEGRIITHEANTSWPMEQLTPSKRAYPEYTDLNFARMLESNGVEIPFTRFDEDRWEAAQRRDFHAPTREELTDV